MNNKYLNQNNELILTFFIENYQGYRTYKVGDSNHYVANISFDKEEPSFYWLSPRDDVDGEPDYPLNEEGTTLIVNDIDKVVYESDSIDYEPSQAEIEALRRLKKLEISLDDRFRYMLLGRMQTDCEYYLGYGFRNVKRLWGLDEQRHISIMKDLYNSFPDDKKPEWITKRDIEQYENLMKPSQIKENKAHDEYDLEI